MKVIVAGYSKTGTKTMAAAAALTELRYRIYDGEHFILQSEEWIKLFSGYGSVADFKQMYKNVDAVTDWPPQSCKSGRAFRVGFGFGGFGLKVDKNFGLDSCLRRTFCLRYTKI